MLISYKNIHEQKKKSYKHIKYCEDFSQRIF